jgi:hypothetical protein
VSPAESAGVGTRLGTEPVPSWIGGSSVAARAASSPRSPWRTNGIASSKVDGDRTFLYEYFSLRRTDPRHLARGYVVVSIRAGARIPGASVVRRGHIGNGARDHAGHYLRDCRSDAPCGSSICIHRAGDSQTRWPPRRSAVRRPKTVRSTRSATICRHCRSLRAYLWARSSGSVCCDGPVAVLVNPEDSPGALLSHRRATC